MKIFTVLLVSILSINSILAQHVSFETSEIICLASEQVHKSKVEFEEDLTNGRLNFENPFELSYTDVPSAAQTTIVRATEIWSRIIRTDIPIKISITWISLSDGVLGSARPASYEANFAGAPRKNTAYPIALAERLARRELNGEDDFEIIINLNKEYTWHYNYAEPIAENTHDLLSVVLHEIGHGLGLADTYTVSGDNGTWGTNSRANIYDTHIYNDREEQLITNYSNFSNELYRQLTSNKLIYYGNLPRQANLGEYPPIYAPSEFNGGSSISHLDETSFPAGDINSLMSPQLGREEVIHQTGPIVDAMLAEMGYVYAFVEHDSVPDQLDITKDIVINGQLEADSTLITEEAFLVYSFDDFLTEKKVNLQINNNQFTATIPSPGFRTRIAFYFILTDVNNLIFRKPTEAAQRNYEFGYGIVTALEEKLADDEMVISLYPNPSTGRLQFVGLDQANPASLSIINSSGKTVYDSPRFDQNQLNLSLPAGVYVVMIGTEGKTHRTRLVIN